MHVNKINTLVPKNGNSNNKNDKNKNTPAFKGVPVLIDNFALGVANAIENGGLAVSFTMQDMIGTNIPRPVMGLFRNRKENPGEKNKKFALKELVREMMTGPSMFIIPSIMLGVGKKIFGKAIDVPANFIKSLGDIHAANPLNEAGQAISKEEFYKNAFTEIIKNAKSETTASGETLETAKNFAERLNQSVSESKQGKSFFGKAKDLACKLIKGDQDPIKNAMTDEFIEISKQYAKDSAHTNFTQASVSPSTSASFRKTIDYITKYADDVVEKAGKQDKGKLNEYIKKITNNKVIGRTAANVVMFAAILAFLQLIPRLYNKAEGSENAGLKGLMKEETLKNESAETKPENSNKTDKKNKSNKSNPSFGSAAKIADTITGSGLAGKVSRGIEFSGCNVSFPMLLGIMGFGIIYPRVKQSKDKYDREEILRRDVTTCATMCFAEKELRKGFSKLNEKGSGFVLAAKKDGFKDQSMFKRFFDYIRPIKGVNVMSSEEIISKYSGIDKYKDKIVGFCDFIDGQGGNLSKVFSLTDDSKQIVENLLAKDGKHIASADNSTIKETLRKAADSKEVENLTNMFKAKDNPWVTKAKTLNARFTALSVIILVPAFLGFFLPFINEKLTKKRIKQEQEDKIANQVSDITMNSAYYNKMKKEDSIFSDIIMFNS